MTDGWVRYRIAKWLPKLMRDRSKIIAHERDPGCLTLHF
jgi:hypothetical protein